MYVDRKGKEITQLEHAELFEDYSYKLVKKDVLANGYRISTVWLGEDDEVFESLVRHPQKDDEEYVGYDTEEDAIKGHKELVRKYMSESY